MAPKKGTPARKGSAVPPGEPAVESLFTEEQLEVYKEIFAVYDKDEDGLVSTKELGSMLYAAVQNPTKAEIKEMVFELDPKMIGNKTVDFTTYLKYVSRRLKEYDTEEELREAFKVFDKEQNGQIIGNELKEALMTLGEPFSEEEITNLFKDAKMNAEGVINYEGLIKMMMKK